jgi:hypothetical protein
MNPWISSGKNLGMHLVGDLLLQATSARNIPDSEWDEYIDEIDRLMRENTIPYSLQYSLTQGPPARVRKLIGKRLGDRMFPNFVLISDSAVVRGILTAISWLIPNPRTKVRAFSPGQEKNALAHLAELRPFKIDVAHAALDALVKEVGYRGLGPLSRRPDAHVSLR